MALPVKVDEVPFTGGLRENEDSWVQAQGFSKLINCYEDKDGAFVKLPGYTQSPSSARTGLVSALGFSGAGKAVKRGGLIGAVLRGTLWAKLDQWTPQGHVSPFVCDQRPIIDTEGVRRADCCAAGAWTFTVFEVLVGARIQLRVAARHAETGETSVLSAAISDATFDCFYPRICQWGTEDGAACVGYVRNGAIRFRRLKMDAGGLSIASEDATTETVASATTPLWDLYKDPVASTFSIAVVGTASHVYVGRGTFGVTAISGYTTSIASGSPNAVTAVAVWYDSVANQLAYAYAHHVAAAPFRHRIRGGVKAFTNFATTVHAEATIWQRTADSGVPPAQADSVRLLSVVGVGATGWYFTFFDPNPPTPLYGGESTIGYVPTQRGVFMSSAGGSIAATADFCGYVRMRSKPFVYDSRVFLLAELLIHSSGTSTIDDANRAYVLLGTAADLSGAKRLVPYGFFSHLQAPRAGFYNADNSPDLTRLMQPFQDSSGYWHVQGYEADAGTLRSRIRDYQLATDDRVASFAELGAQTYVAGALLSAWDGIRCLEAGVLRAPIMDNVSQTAGSLGAGTRYYIATFARVSATGELLRGFPSPAKVATNTGVQNNVVQWTPLCVTATSDSDSLPWFVELWRTKAGETAPFYLLTRIALSPNQRDYMSYTDSTSDTTLTGATNGPTELPMFGGAGAELGNDPPLSPVHICEWRNRIWITDGEQIQYSKEGTPNRAAEFAGAFTLPRALPQRLTAVGPHGDVLAVFTEDLAAYVYGDGPAANGEGSSLTGPVVVPGELGCVQPSGLVVVPGGLLVPTRRGLQRFDTKRSFQFVGEGVEDTFRAFPRIRDADYQLGDDLVWFAITSQDGIEGEFALYNLRTGAWSTAFLSGTAATVPVTVRHVGGEQYWGSANGLSYERTPGSYLLNGTEYRQRIRLPWIKAAGMVGEMRFRRMWLLGSRGDTSLPPTGLDISVFYDFNDPDGAPDGIAQLTNADLTNVGLGTSRMLARFAAPRQRCTSFLIDFTENLNAGVDSAGFRFVTMRVETAQRRPRGAVVRPSPAGFS